MSRLRIVLDTNIIISAAFQPAGPPAQVIELVAYRAVEMCASEEVLTEYREVFGRPKFARLDPQRVSQLLTLLAGEATMVAPTERLAVSRHESDNRFTNVPPPPMPITSSRVTPDISPRATKPARSSPRADCSHYWPPKCRIGFRALT